MTLSLKVVLLFCFAFSRLYPAGVSSAGLWNVAVVHGVSTDHAPLLVLGDNMQRRQVKCWVRVASVVTFYDACQSRRFEKDWKCADREQETFDFH